MRWNPWRALRNRPHLTLEWAPLDGCEGRIEDRPEGRVIVLDPSLSRTDRNAALAHELIHDERGIFYTEHTPAAIVEKEEHAVRRETTARLVPMAELIAFVDATQIIIPIRAEEVAERFDVPLDVAADALRRMPAF